MAILSETPFTPPVEPAADDDV